MSEAKAYKAIVNFINELNEVFGETQKSLRLYAHLLGKTSPMCKIVVAKHIDVFRKFCVVNRESILSKSKLVKDTVVYSKKVFIDVQSILDSSDNETKKVIWRHIMTISALVDPSAKIKELLKMESSQSNETDFITGMMSKVGNHIGSSQAGENPMNIISNLMSSGIFTELVNNMGSEIQDGNLDFSKLVGTVQTMMGTLTNNDPKAMNMVNSIISPIIQSVANSDEFKSASQAEGAEEVKEEPVSEITEVVIEPLDDDLEKLEKVKIE